MYVDESGDPGNNTQTTKYFCLTGLVVHERDWHELINHLVLFRKRIKTIYGFPLRSEIHAAELIRSGISDIPKHERLAILRNFIDELGKIDTISLTNIVVDKSNKPESYQIYENAWRTLFQRFENTLRHSNYPRRDSESFGTVYTDATSGRKLQLIMRKMAVHNPIPNFHASGYRNIPITRIIEDPSERNSKTSLPIQACDVSAYFLMQSLSPNAYIRRKSAQTYFERLKPILNLRAGKTDPLGIVKL